MINNEKALNAFMEALQNAGLPVGSVFPDGKVRYTRPLTVREQSDADTIVDAYKAGRFDYLDKRVYPSVGDQLDMIYWDNINGTTEWRDAITAIKDANPKPEEIA